MPIRIEGYEKTIKAMRSKDGRVDKNVQEGITKCVDMVFDRSQKYVPVDTAELKRSAKKEVKGKGISTQGKVSYNAPHAYIVHERTEVAHRAPTCAKYLERAVRELRGSMTAMMKRQLEVK